MYAVDALANVRYVDGMIQLADLKFENWVPSLNVILAVRLLVLSFVPTKDVVPSPIDQLVVSVIAVTLTGVSTTVTVVVIVLPVELDLKPPVMIELPVANPDSMKGLPLPPDLDIDEVVPDATVELVEVETSTFTPSVRTAVSLAQPRW
jgi:hypothetical protein